MRLNIAKFEPPQLTLAGLNFYSILVVMHVPGPGTCLKLISISTLQEHNVHHSVRVQPRGQIKNIYIYHVLVGEHIINRSIEINKIKLTVSANIISDPP